MGHRGVSRVHVAVLPKHPVKVAAAAQGKKPAARRSAEAAHPSLRKSADAAPSDNR